MNARQILEATKARLTPETWGQGSTCGWSTTSKVCLGIAFGEAQPRDLPFEDFSKVNYEARAALEGEIVSLGYLSWDVPLVRFNDKPGRTLDEVHALLDRAIAGLQ